MTRASKYVVAILTEPPRWRVAISIAIIVALTLAIGLVDYATTAFISFRPFYYIPIALAVSWFGWKAGSAASFLAVAVWIVGDYHADSPMIRGPGFVGLWNTCIALVTFHIMVWTLQLLIVLHREMELRVQHRTRSLEDALAAQEQLRQQVVAVSARERNAVGRELHDGLCQHLAATAFAAQVHADRIAVLQPTEQDNARRIVAMTQQAMTQSRNAASGLLLAAIPPHRLGMELNEFATTISREGNIACRFEEFGRPCVKDADTAAQVYRIAQEAVRNAVKHAQPSAIQMALSGDSQRVELSVLDDGVGIPPPERRKPGMGLEIMAYRAGAIGASLSVEALPAGGTRVCCIWSETAQLN